MLSPSTRRCARQCFSPLHWSPKLPLSLACIYPYPWSNSQIDYPLITWLRYFFGGSCFCFSWWSPCGQIDWDAQSSYSLPSLFNATCVDVFQDCCVFRPVWATTRHRPDAPVHLWPCIAKDDSNVSWLNKYYTLKCIVDWKLCIPQSFRSNLNVTRSTGIVLLHTWLSWTGHLVKMQTALSFQCPFSGIETSLIKEIHQC